MARQEQVRSDVATLKATVDQFMSGSLTYEAFTARMREQWDRIGKSGSAYSELVARTVAPMRG